MKVLEPNVPQIAGIKKPLKMVSLKAALLASNMAPLCLRLRALEPNDSQIAGIKKADPKISFLVKLRY